MQTLYQWWYGAEREASQQRLPPALVAEMNTVFTQQRTTEYAEGRVEAHDLIERLRRRIEMVRTCESPTQRRRLLAEVFDMCAMHARIVHQNPIFAERLRNKMICYTHNGHADLRNQYWRLYGESMPFT